MEKNTIESLFGNDTNLPFWELRARSEKEGIDNSDFLQAVNAAIKSGDIEVDSLGGVKWMGGYYPTPIAAKFQFRLSGRKAPNNYCKDVLEYAKIVASVGAIQKSYTDSTIEDIFGNVVEYSENMKPQRSKPIKVEWLGGTDAAKQRFGIWENENAVWRTASALAYISIVED